MLVSDDRCNLRNDLLLLNVLLEIDVLSLFLVLRWEVQSALLRWYDLFHNIRFLFSHNRFFLEFLWEILSLLFDRTSKTLALILTHIKESLFQNLIFWRSVITLVRIFCFLLFCHRAPFNLQPFPLFFFCFSFFKLLRLKKFSKWSDFSLCLI